MPELYQILLSCISNTFIGVEFSALYPYNNIFIKTDSKTDSWPVQLSICEDTVSVDGKLYYVTSPTFFNDVLEALSQTSIIYWHKRSFNGS